MIPDLRQQVQSKDQQQLQAAISRQNSIYSMASSLFITNSVALGHEDKGGPTNEQLFQWSLAMAEWVHGAINNDAKARFAGGQSNQVVRE